MRKSVLHDEYRVVVVLVLVVVASSSIAVSLPEMAGGVKMAILSAGSLVVFDRLRI